MSAKLFDQFGALNAFCPLFVSLLLITTPSSQDVVGVSCTGETVGVARSRGKCVCNALTSKTIFPSTSWQNAVYFYDYGWNSVLTGLSIHGYSLLTSVLWSSSNDMWLPLPPCLSPLYRSWLGALHKVRDGSEPQHYPSPTYAKSEPPPITGATAPPLVHVAATQRQVGLGPPAPPMPHHSPQMPRALPQQPPPYTQHANTLPHPPHQPPPPDYRHSFSGPMPPQPTYYPPPVAQPRYCAPPPQPRPYYPPPPGQPGAYAPPQRPPAYYQPRPPPVQFAPRPPPAQFAPRPYAPPPQQPRAVQQQQTNVVVVKL